jgi:pimeloyl-ACP methyl ester carboxylesterase
MVNEIDRREALAGAAALTAIALTPEATAQSGPAPFQAHVPASVIGDLRRRLRAARVPTAIDGAGWAYGVDSAEMRIVLEAWRQFDWRAFETRFNALPQFTAQIDGHSLHFVHARAAATNAKPLLLLHGWPSSVVQFMDIIPLLNAAGFHVVAPSLPGFGFSAQPSAPGMGVRRVGELMSKLMTETLGYSRYGARGSDLGAGVLQQIALARPQELMALHLSGTNPFVAFRPNDMSAEERTFVARADQWMQSEMAYASLHSTKPQTVAYALNDSPAGLAAWIFEKFHAWTDRKDDVIGRYGADKLLANLTIYWATQTIGSSIRLYAETARDQGAQWGRAATPTAMLMASLDMFPTPRAWAERSWNVQRWAEIDRGGHFLEWEEPDLVARDIQTFYAGHS